MKKPTYSILLQDADKEIIERIKELTGLGNTSDIIRQALRVYHADLEPMYLRKTPSKRPTYENPEDRVKAQIEKKRIEDATKRAIITEAGIGICNALDGVLVEQEGGNLACTFKLYEKVGKRVLIGERTVPVDNLHENLIDTQYKGGTKYEIHTLLDAKS